MRSWIRVESASERVLVLRRKFFRRELLRFRLGLLRFGFRRGFLFNHLGRWRSLRDRGSGCGLLRRRRDLAHGPDLGLADLDARDGMDRLGSKGGRLRLIAADGTLPPHAEWL